MFAARFFDRRGGIAAWTSAKTREGWYSFTNTNCIIALPSGTNYNTAMGKLKLTPQSTRGSQVASLGEDHWRFSCAGGKAGEYRLAQMDDYRGLKRSHLAWTAPCHLKLEARASARQLAGTWGFGFWNDPFGMNLGFGGGRRLPEFPDAAWFFFASEPNHLSFRDHLPAQGALAAVFRSPGVPLWMLAPLGAAAPLLLLRRFSRLARRLAATLVQEDAADFTLDLTEWHSYELIWQASGVEYLVDGETVQRTLLSPRGPLGLVLWLDNQFAAWRPDGRLNYGTLETDARWIEIRSLAIA